MNKPLKQQVKDCLKLIDEQRYALNVAHSEIDLFSEKLKEVKGELFDTQQSERNNFLAFQRSENELKFCKKIVFISFSFNLLVISSIIWKGF